MFYVLLFILATANGILALMDYNAATIDGFTLVNTFVAGALFVQSFYVFLEDR